MRVLIIDDDPLFRDGMRALLACLDPALDVIDVHGVAQAPRAMEGIDLVLLDMNLPGCGREDALRWIAASSLVSSVVIVSAEQGSEWVRRAIEEGALGFVPKTTDQALIIEALKQVLAQGVSRMRGRVLAPLLATGDR